LGASEEDMLIRITPKTVTKVAMAIPSVKRSFKKTIAGIMEKKG